MIKKAIKYLIDPDYRFMFNRAHGMYKEMSDEEYLKRLYHAETGRTLNLNEPKRFNEKIQWLKLYDRKPIYTTMVDKAEAKKYVADIIGEEYIIPTIGIWDSVEDIDFDSLPDQFVLKCTHDSHGLVICKDKSALDIADAKKKLSACLKRNYYLRFREWPYKNVKPRIIAEKYLEDRSTGELRDYKFFAFNGDVKLMFVASERQKKEETKFDFFDMSYKHLELINGHPNAKTIPEKPVSFETMKLLASILSQNIPNVRIDFYEVDGKPYFGEITFSHWSGLKPFQPDEWDTILGSWITLPPKS